MILINLCKMFHLLTSGFDHSLNLPKCKLVCVPQENTYFTLII